MKRTLIATAGTLLLVGCASSGSSDSDASSTSAAVAATYLMTLDMLRKPFDSCDPKYTVETCANELARVRSGLGAIAGNADSGLSPEAQRFTVAARDAYSRVDAWLDSCVGLYETQGCVSTRPGVDVLTSMEQALN